MADDLTKLLNFIVERPLMQNEALEAERDASAVQDVPAEIGAIAQDSRTQAARLAPSFAEGLRMAAQSGGRVVVDDTNPQGNDIADAFARFLVTTGLATSQSSDLSEGHYRYTFDVDWPRLQALARSAGINLDSALHSAS